MLKPTRVSRNLVEDILQEVLSIMLALECIYVIAEWKALVCKFGTRTVPEKHFIECYCDEEGRGGTRN